MSYQRPRVNHSVDPQNVNWLWNAIARAWRVAPDDVVKALQARGIAISAARVKKWRAGADSAQHSPMNLTELVTVIEALGDYYRSG